LAVPENKINEIFAYYDKHKKITVEEMDEDYFRAQMYSKIGVNKDISIINTIFLIPSTEKHFWE